MSKSGGAGPLRRSREAGVGAGPAGLPNARHGAPSLRNLLRDAVPPGSGSVGSRLESCGFVDESCGPARALRAVWTARGQRWRVAHRLTTLARLSPTTPQGRQPVFSSKNRNGRVLARHAPVGQDHLSFNTDSNSAYDSVNLSVQAHLGIGLDFGRRLNALLVCMQDVACRCATFWIVVLQVSWRTARWQRACGAVREVVHGGFRFGLISTNCCTWRNYFGVKNRASTQASTRGFFRVVTMRGAWSSGRRRHPGRPHTGGSDHARSIRLGRRTSVRRDGANR